MVDSDDGFDLSLILQTKTFIRRTFALELAQAIWALSPFSKPQNLRELKQEWFGELVGGGKKMKIKGFAQATKILNAKFVAVKILEDRRAKKWAKEL